MGPMSDIFFLVFVNEFGPYPKLVGQIRGDFNFGGTLMWGPSLILPPPPA